MGLSYFWGHMLHFEKYALLEQNNCDQCNGNDMLMMAP